MLRIAASAVIALLAAAPALAQSIGEPLPGRSAKERFRPANPERPARACPEYGPGFVRVEGSSFCVRAGGSVRRRIRQELAQWPWRVRLWLLGRGAGAARGPWRDRARPRAHHRADARAGRSRAGIRAVPLLSRGGSRQRDQPRDLVPQHGHQLILEPGVALQPGIVAPGRVRQRQHARPAGTRQDRAPVRDRGGEIGPLARRRDARPAHSGRPPG